MTDNGHVDKRRYLLDLAEIYDLFQKVNTSQLQLAIMLTQSSNQPTEEVQKLVGMLNGITAELDRQVDILKGRVKELGVKVDI